VPSLHGKRLKPSAVGRFRGPGVDIGAVLQMPLDQLGGIAEPSAQGDFRDHAAGAANGKDKHGASGAERAATAMRSMRYSPDGAP